MEIESIYVQSECRPMRFKLTKPKGFWIHSYDQPSFYVSQIPALKQEGFLKRIKAKAKQVRDLKRNPRMIRVPWKVKLTTPSVIGNFNPSKVLESRYTNKMIESKFYGVLKIGSTVHTRGRIIKTIKMKKTSKRKR